MIQERIVPFAKLRGRILEKHGTQAAFARRIGLNPTTLNAKLNGRTGWTVSEVEASCECLDIPASEAHLYFFAK